MCNLCDPTTRDVEIRRANNLARMLETLANRYRNLANGVLVPHTDGFTQAEPLAKSVIRNLLEDWL